MIYYHEKEQRRCFFLPEEEPSVPFEAGLPYFAVFRCTEDIFYEQFA